MNDFVKSRITELILALWTWYEGIEVKARCGLSMAGKAVREALSWGPSHTYTAVAFA